jgi:uncharacterized protein (DUF1501 family)
MHLTRRSALLGLTSALSLTGVAGQASLALAAAPTNRRFVVVILRGAMDGLAVVAPYGDPALAGLRGEIAPPPPGQPNGLRDLGGFYGLHPALANLHAMYQAGELLVVHAAAGPYRSRSHFEAQDCLESGADHRLTSGWLNRAIAAMPQMPEPPSRLALAVGVSVPLVLRGPASVGSWAPHGFAAPPPDLYARIAQVNQADRLTGPAIAEGLRARDFANEVMANGATDKGRGAFPALAQSAGRLLAAEAGPRIAAMELNGWDTHVAQVARLEPPLSQLDAGLDALRTALGPAWRQTAVLVLTEFGRTARINGDRGTDHGTASAAFVLGGAVAGGRVRADWPGLGPGKLFENRDLAPTLDIREVAKGLLARHLGLSSSALAQVFPGIGTNPPMDGLLRA